MSDPGDFVTDYELSFAPMAELGWTAETVAWRKPQDWDAFDAVYLCTPWDYPQHPADFMRVLECIDASRAVLLNDIAIVRWNLDKSYLRDLEERGDAIVPSRWLEQFTARDVRAAFAEFGVHKLVVKPTIGGNAVDTFVLEDPLPADLLARLEKLFVARACIVQPFMENILEEGEYSLFFFNGEYSHAIRKVPRRGDFRVQEEHGADIMPATPPQALLETARTVFSHVEPLPVYGRGDWVRGPDGRFLLMELELIEPSLYLRTDSGAAARFARAFDQRFQELAGK